MKFRQIVPLLLIALALSGCGRERADSTPTPAAAFATATSAGAESVSASAPAVEVEEVAEAAVAPAGDAENGKTLFATACSACHGPEGLGVPGLGKDMTTSEFIAELSDEALLEFIKVGRAPTDPLNTTGVLMPPKGGNPALSDQDLLDVIAFIRTIHQ